MREKNFQEQLADAIPGLKGYRDKEARRDNDNQLREYRDGRMDRVRKNMDEIQRKMAETGFEGLDESDGFSQKLLNLANSIRHASYGYSGFFDKDKIQEAELDRIYQYDLSLISDVETLEKSIVPSRSFAESKEEWRKELESMEDKIAERKNLFTSKQRALGETHGN